MSTITRGIAVVTSTGKLTHLPNYRARVRGRTHCGRQWIDMAEWDTSTVTCEMCARKEAEDPITNPELAIIARGGVLPQKQTETNDA